MKAQRAIIAVLSVLVLTIGIVLYVNTRSAGDDIAPPITSQTNKDTTSDPTSVSPTNATSTEAQLLYMIEEEKLAHDVYTVMYEKYGARVFGNILKSESTHQDKVLTLLAARNIADPRSSEVGVFRNQDLQKFYDQLIEQGNNSATDAYKAGVAIEERDIADLTAQLAIISDQDIVIAYESLRSASENHLRAFNNQL